MQKFYTDKSKLFECNISVDGANINETKARLILEFPNKRNLLFYGNIDRNGKCEVEIPALKEMNECEGTALLEIIAESTYFESWRDKFTLETKKKIQVEVVTTEKELITNKLIPRIEILNEEIEEKSKFDEFKKYINENNINFGKAMKNKSEFFSVLSAYKRKTNSSKEDIIGIVEEIKEIIKTNKTNELLVL